MGRCRAPRRALPPDFGWAAVRDRSVAVAVHLAALPDSAWSDLHGLAGDLLARFHDTPHAELERGIAISLEIARTKLADAKTPRQERIAAALTDGGEAGAAALLAAEWAGHSAAFRSVPR